jgi:hypothetical protein
MSVIAGVITTIPITATYAVGLELHRQGGFLARLHDSQKNEGKFSKASGARPLPKLKIW